MNYLWNMRYLHSNFFEYNSTIFGTCAKLVDNHWLRRLIPPSAQNWRAGRARYAMSSNAIESLSRTFNRHGRPITGRSGGRLKEVRENKPSLWNLLVLFEKDPLLLIDREIINNGVYFSTSADLSRRVGEACRRFFARNKGTSVQVSGAITASLSVTSLIKSEALWNLRFGRRPSIRCSRIRVILKEINSM